MSDPKYVKYKPTVFGAYYWYRYERGFNYLFGPFEGIVYIDSEGKYVTKTGDEEEISLEHAKGEWAGPIPKPSNSTETKDEQEQTS